MRRVLTAVVFVIVSAARGAGAASTSAALDCVKQAQVDLKTCRNMVHEAGDQCTTTYFTAIPPCFGTEAPCASDCITTRMGCENGPKAQEMTCSAGCNQKAKALQAKCKGPSAQADEACTLRVKLSVLKCTQKCTRAVTIPLQRCSLDFTSCLKSCASGTGS